MRKVVVGLISAFMLVAMAAPALAQPEGSPVVEVSPIEVELPLPAAGTGTGTGTPSGTPRMDRTEVLGTPLARTGFAVTGGVVLGVGLLLVGGAALLIAHRRRALGEL